MWACFHPTRLTIPQWAAIYWDQQKLKTCPDNMPFTGPTTRRIFNEVRLLFKCALWLWLHRCNYMKYLVPFVCHTHRCWSLYPAAHIYTFGWFVRDICHRWTICLLGYALEILCAVVRIFWCSQFDTFSLANCWSWMIPFEVSFFAHRSTFP